MVTTAGLATSITSSKPESLNPLTVPNPPPTYNQVAVTLVPFSSKLTTLAGQVGIDETSGAVISTDIKKQARIVDQNIANCLTAAGATPWDIIHACHYIVKDTGNAEVDAVEVVDRGWGSLRIEFMDRAADGHRPPDTVLGVASLAKASLLYEVEVWAIVQN